MTGKKNLTERAENLFKEKHKRFPSSEADEDALASCVEACRKDETLGLISGEDEEAHPEGAEVAKKKITKVTKDEDAEETPKAKSKKEKKEKKVKAKKSEDKPAAEAPKKRGRPPGSKNGTKKEKPAKAEPKKKRGRPPGTKNKVVKAAKTAKAEPKRRGRPPGTKKKPLTLERAIAAKERGIARAAGPKADREKAAKTGKRGRQPKMVLASDLKAVQKELKLAAKARRKLEKAFAAYRTKTLKATNRLLKFAAELA